MNNFQLDRGNPTRLVSLSYALLLLALLLFGGSVFAGTDIKDLTAKGEVTVEPIEPLSAEELGDLISPIALYPDDLLAIVLPAATYPLQIVQAARFLEAHENNPTLEPDEDWDDSIIALLNYPEIIALLNDDLDWTWQLGEAVLVQEADLIAAVADFRERARIAGNLESDEHQIVAVDDEGAIEIKPADPEVIYVPYYEPERVTVYQRHPVYHYYPHAYPVYYYPYRSDYVFSTGYFWGVTSVFSIGWHTHRLHLHHYGYDSHPYYNYSYYDPFYNRHPHLWLSFDYSRYYDHHRNRHGHHRHHRGNQWQPDGVRAGARPRNPDGDWRDERRLDHERGNRRREHVVAERRSREAERRETGRSGSRLITNGTSRDGVPNARNTREVSTRRDQPRVHARANGGRTVRVNGRADDARRTVLATESNAQDIERRTQRVVRSQSRQRRPAGEVRSQSPERVTKIERRSTPARKRRVESMRGTNVAAADVRAPRTERARPSPARTYQARFQPARVQAALARQARAPAPTRAAAPVEAQHQSRESRSNNHAAKQRSSGNQPSGRHRSQKRSPTF